MRKRRSSLVGLAAVAGLLALLGLQGPGQARAQQAASYHSADYTAPQDWKISLSELLRVIQLYNLNEYSCGTVGTEDGYLPGAGSRTCATHRGDYQNGADWKIGLSELLRVIQFYNLGGYHVDVAGEDGYNPGLPTATFTAQTVSGSIGIGAAAAAKAAVATDALVEVRSYSKSDALAAVANTTSGASGFFTVKLDLPDDGGYVTVRARKDGFTDTVKRADFVAPQDLTVNADLHSVTTVVAAKGLALKASGESSPGFTLAVVRYADGTRLAVGSATEVMAAKANGAVTELQIAVPATSLPEDTETLRGSLKSFDPNDPADARSFPGDYVDQDGNRLVSVAFDFVEITDQDGTGLAALGPAQAAKAAADPVEVTRWIPSDSCQALTLGDFCDGTDDPALCSVLTSPDGFQVPVYTLNRVKGIWDLLGVGTIVLSDGTQVAIGTVTPANCQAAGYYLKILVTNEDFLRQWWNLDYPLVFAEPVQVCIEMTFATNATRPLGSISVSLQDDDAETSYSYSYGYTDANNKVTLSAIITDGSDDLIGRISYWNPYIYENVTETVTLGLHPDCTQKTNTFTVPPVCTVEGRVLDDAGAPKVNELVQITPVSGSRFYGSTYTGTGGLFAAEVPCTRDLNLFIGSDGTADASFKVNGAIADFPDFERTDNGSAVALKDVTAVNAPPQAWGWLASNGVREGSATTAELTAWDYDGHYPLTYVLKAGTQTVASGQFATAAEIQKTVTLAGLALGPHSVVFTVTDQRGGVATADLGTLTVTSPGQNQPPVVWAWADTYQIEEAGQQIAFRSSAYDLDGDLLDYVWTVNGQQASTAQSYVFTVPSGVAAGYKAEAVVTVSDGLTTTSTRFTVYFGTPAEVDVIIR